MSIKNIVIAGIATATTAVCAGIIIKHISDKNEAEQKAAFEKAAAESQAQQAARCAAVKQHNEEVLKKLEEDERISKENRANMERAWRIEDAVIELEKKLDSARRAGKEIIDGELDNMNNELHKFAKEIDEIAATGNDYFKKDVAVARTRDRIIKVHDDIADYRDSKKEKEA